MEGLRVCLPLTIAAVCFAGGRLGAQVDPSWRGFEEVAEARGCIASGMTFGASWGDVDGDGDPDLFVSRHYSNAGLMLLRNDDGRFSDATGTVLPESSRLLDRHGGLFVDLEGDGDLDLLVAMGASWGTGRLANRVFVQEDGVLVDRAVEYGLADELARARMFSMIDLDGIGRIDLVGAGLLRPDGLASTEFFVSDPGGAARYLDVSAMIPHVLSCHYVQPFVGGTARVPMLFAQTWPALLLSADWPLTPLDLGIPRIGRVFDSAFFDADGDGDQDAFLACFLERPGWARLDPETLVLRIEGAASQHSFRLRPLDPREQMVLHITSARWLTSEVVFVGEGGWHPEVSGSPRALTLDPADPRCAGRYPHEPGQVDALCISFLPYNGTWEIAVSWIAWASMDIRVEFASGIRDAVPLDFDSDPPLPANEAWFWDQAVGRFQRPSVPSAWEGLGDVVSVAAADFDNDMDVDLFAVRSGPALNLEDVLLVNDGRGAFAPAPAGLLPAAGPTGRGESVAVADFDGDGWLDVAVTNGGDDDPVVRAPVRLFRNLGGVGHWLEVDLEAERGGRHPVGAVVEARVAGHRLLRDYSGGVHRVSQNHDRLHFGLGDHPVVDELIVRWPDGGEDRFLRVPADRILRLRQGAGELSFKPIGAVGHVDG